MDAFRCWAAPPLRLAQRKGKAGAALDCGKIHSRAPLQSRGVRPVLALMKTPCRGTMMTTLYAWVKPINALGNLADHTWVTTYDSRIVRHASIGEVAKAGQCYWYCWGDFHAEGEGDQPGGHAVQAPADLARAHCLVKPNQSATSDLAARGTINLYGIHGVCHQVANQVLYACHAATPPTVKAARGYWKSLYVYGQYGTRDAAWLARRSSCNVGAGAGTKGMAEGSDEFLAAARRVLADDPALLAEVLARRAALQAGSGATKSLGDDDLTAESINAVQRAAIAEVAELLGEDRFVALFGHDPEDQVDLVDPAIFNAGRGVAEA
jgi:hypothetical protein